MVTFRPAIRRLICFLLVLTGLFFLWSTTAAERRAPQEPTPTALLEPPADYNFVHPRSIACGDQQADLSYRVPLTAEQETRAMAVYRRSFVILAHIHCVESWDVDEMIEGGITAVILKVDTDGINLINGTRGLNLEDEDWVPRATRSMLRVKEMAGKADSRVRIVRNVEDLHFAKREGKLGVIFGFEGARPLEGKLENVRYFSNLGLRELQLWWAVPNDLKTDEGTDLSAFGEDVIREMNRQGIVIDLSHMTGTAFARALELSRDPVIISHCAVAAVLDPSRRSEAQSSNTVSGTDHLNDAAIRALADNGGAICLHFVTPDYIRASHGTDKATVVDLIDHAEYIRDLVGIDYVALGADYFPELGWHWIEGAGRPALMPNVAREMVRRGFTDEEISLVLGGNLMRVFERVWK